MIYPSDCDTPAKRTEYGYRAQELLRILHNTMGQWCREGIAQTLWEQLPQRIKNRYPYSPQLSQGQWNDFQISIFEPISEKIISIILENRALLKQSVAWSISVEDL